MVLRVEYACTESSAGLFGVLDDGVWDSGTDGSSLPSKTCDTTIIMNLEF